MKDTNSSDKKSLGIKEVATGAAKNPKSLPSVGVLLRESWDLLKVKIKPLVIIHLLQFAIIVAALFVIVFLAVMTLAPFGLTGILNMYEGTAAALIALLPTIAVYLLLIFVVMIMVLAVVGAVFQAASFKILSKEITVGKAIRDSFKYVPRLFAASILIGFIVAGGLFFFIIPGVFLAFYLIFVPFEIVLENKKVMPAIRHSVALVKSNSKDVFLKLFFWLAATVVITSILEKLFNSPDGNPTLLFNLATYPVGLFGSVYFFKLYQKLKASAPKVQPANLKWLVVVSLLGWCVLALSAQSILRIASMVGESDFMENLNNPMPIETIDLR